MMEVLIDGVRYVPITDQSPELPEGYLSPHFRVVEFACNHCGELGNGIDQELIYVLEKLRAHFNGSPVTINSGYRCETHNANVGSSPYSQHRKGTAADIVVRDVSPNTVHAYLVATYPDKYGIGQYSSFTHIDVRKDKARW